VLPDFTIAPHAGQQRRNQLGKVAHGGHAQQKVGVALRGRRFLFAFQFFVTNAELGCVGTMQAHLGLQNSGQQFCEARHRLEVRTACNSQGQQAPVVDEKQVILPHPHFELLDVQRTVSDPAHKRVLVLRLPD
jgi:hypothetical protein